MFFLLKALVLGAPSSLILRRCTKAPSLRTLRRCFCASIFSPQSLRCVRCVSSFCAFLFHHVLSVIDLKLLKPFSKHIEQNDNDMITKWSLECWLFQVFSHQRKPFRRNSLVRCRIFSCEVSKGLQLQHEDLPYENRWKSWVWNANSQSLSPEETCLNVIVVWCQTLPHPETDNIFETK